MTGNGGPGDGSRYRVNAGGPLILVPAAEVRDRVRRGELAADALVCPEAGGEWVAAGHLLDHLTRPADRRPVPAPPRRPWARRVRGGVLAVIGTVGVFALAGLGKAGLKALGVLERNPGVAPAGVNASL